MIAAIYARKSTEQNGVNDEEKSVTRQVEHAKAYAAKKSWTVAEEHIYVDDGVSGAEFVKRPGFLRLMNALKPRPPFQVLVMSEEARLGRESIETAYALKQIVIAGVRVFFYLEDRERLLETPTDKVMLSLTAFADELEREKARQRTYDAMLRKAKALQVTGGRVFGYDNREVFPEDPGPEGHRKRLYVQRVINSEEAATIRRIFEMCAAGMGLKRIAIALNDEGVPAPLPRREGRPRAWAPSTIREILYRPLYCGEIVWNKVRKRDHWGRKKYERRPESQWIRLQAPELRLVSDELRRGAHERLEASRATYVRSNNGQLGGRPANGIESKYLLTGMAQCECCGGSLIVTSQDGKDHRKLFYACSYNRFRGSSVCANTLKVPMEVANREILSTVESDLLTLEVVEAAVRKALDHLQPSQDAMQAKREALKGELLALEAELSKLTAAIAGGLNSLASWSP